ncbi:T-cell receptor gamma alternate reading frame protein [Chelonoidis abingdonii]|uniref:T-cell receptor gamma alternate reading frame protein n=1 Tax=Chelonoidis abingdonii TaxID=106734 RepID=UPI003F498E1E
MVICTVFCKGFAHCDTSSGYLFKVFGSGTKLIVTDTPAKLDSTKIQALPPSTEEDGKVSYMCLIQDFYPNIIKVTWEDENKNAEKNGVHEEIWPPGDNQQSYSLSSWLTVDKNSNKNYRCKYQHESKGDYVPMESPDTFSDTTVMPQTTRGCIKFAENDTMLSTDIMDSFIHRTAYLIYIVLLLKSTMYYVIVLFFIYRMQSPIKRHGRKP